MAARNPVLQIVSDFERYLSYAFELVAADEKSGVVNSIISAMKKDTTGTGQPIVRPEFRPMFSTIAAAFVNSTQHLQESCLSYFFCKSTGSLVAKNFMFAVEVLQTVM